MRERDALRAAGEAQVEAQRALTEAERARAERAEAALEAERVDRRQLITQVTGSGDGRKKPASRGGAKKPGTRRTAAATTADAE